MPAEVPPMSSAGDGHRADALLMADLLATAIREALGPPRRTSARSSARPSTQSWRGLRALTDEGIDLRIAYLNPTAAEAAFPRGYRGRNL